MKNWNLDKTGFGANCNSWSSPSQRSIPNFDSGLGVNSYIVFT